MGRLDRPEGELWKEIRDAIENGNYLMIEERTVKNGKVYVGVPYNGRRAVVIVLPEKDSVD